MAVKFTKYGVQYKKHITWYPGMDDPVQPGDNPGGGPLENPFGGGGGTGGGGTGGTGGGTGGGGYIPGGTMMCSIPVMQRMALDYDTQLIQVIPDASVYQSMHPSFFHHHRSVIAILQYQGDGPASGYPDIYQQPASLDEGGQIIYDSLSANAHLGGDPAEGLIDPTTSMSFNPDYDAAAGRWIGGIHPEKPVWIKVTRAQPEKWLGAGFYASSEPFNTTDQIYDFVTTKIAFDNNLAEEWLTGNTPPTGSDTGSTGTGSNDAGWFPNPAWAAGNTMENIESRNPDGAPIPWNYDEPVLPMAVSFLAGTESPSGMLMINTTVTSSYLTCVFNKIQLDLNKVDVAAVYETEFTEFIPDDKYLMTKEEWGEYYDANKPGAGIGSVDGDGRG